jgi:hypothetical protein
MTRSEALPLPGSTRMRGSAPLRREAHAEVDLQPPPRGRLATADKRTGACSVERMSLAMRYCAQQAQEQRPLTMGYGRLEEHSRPA